MSTAAAAEVAAAVAAAASAEYHMEGPSNELFISPNYDANSVRYMHLGSRGVRCAFAKKIKKKKKEEEKKHFLCV